MIAAELRPACATGQSEAAGVLAHKLKSSARSVGALALGEVCAEMENVGNGGDVEALAALLPRFDEGWPPSSIASRPIEMAAVTNKQTIRILVLDDEPFMLKLLDRMLANLGFTSVRTCGSGAEPWQLLDGLGKPAGSHSSRPEHAGNGRCRIRAPAGGASAIPAR